MLLSKGMFLFQLKKINKLREKITMLLSKEMPNIYLKVRKTDVLKTSLLYRF